MKDVEFVGKIGDKPLNPHKVEMCESLRKALLQSDELVKVLDAINNRINELKLKENKDNE